MSRPLLKLGGGSGDILSDVLHLPGVSEAETVISGAEGRDGYCQVEATSGRVGR